MAILNASKNDVIKQLRKKEFQITPVSEVAKFRNLVNFFNNLNYLIQNYILEY